MSVRKVAEVGLAERGHGQEREQKTFGSAEPEEQRHRERLTGPDVPQPRDDGASPSGFGVGLRRAAELAEAGRNERNAEHHCQHSGNGLVRVEPFDGGLAE